MEHYMKEKEEERLKLLKSEENKSYNDRKYKIYLWN
jgi:hypothetical protein